MTDECTSGDVGSGLGSAKAGVTGARVAHKDRAAASAAVLRSPMQTNSLLDGFLMGVTPSKFVELPTTTDGA
jgi:hypothetical protein